MTFLLFSRGFQQQHWKAAGSFIPSLCVHAMNFRRMKLKCPISMQRPCLSRIDGLCAVGMQSGVCFGMETNLSTGERLVFYSFLCLFPG